MVRITTTLLISKMLALVVQVAVLLLPARLGQAILHQRRHHKATMVVAGQLLRRDTVQAVAVALALLVVMGLVQTAVQAVTEPRPL